MKRGGAARASGPPEGHACQSQPFAALHLGYGAVVDNDLHGTKAQAGEQPRELASQSGIQTAVQAGACGAGHRGGGGIGIGFNHGHR